MKRILIFLLLGSAVCVNVCASQSQPLQKFLNPDGTLKTPAGLSGSLDGRGWKMHTSPDGTPRFIPSSISKNNSALTDPVDAAWDSRFSIVSTDDYVDAIAVHGTQVYIAGAFTSSGGVPVNYILRWDGSSWTPLGAGLNGAVTSLAVDANGDLFAGGDFTATADANVSANHVARWDGTQWSPLALGTNDYVNAVTTNGTDVYVGGHFTTAGGLTAHRIAKWNGSSWSTLGNGVDDDVYAIAVMDTMVYVGGVFQTVSGDTMRHIARWNGTTWSSLGLGLYNGGVFALAFVGTDLYAGGAFTQYHTISPTGGVFRSAKRIAKWNGVWSQPGNGIDDGTVFSLSPHGGTRLFVGGSFTTIAATSVTRIADWDGSNWSPVGSGMNSNVYALAMQDTELYAGGNFTTAGPDTINHAAKWNGSSWSALGTGGPNGSVFAVALTPTGSGGTDVYVGGAFTKAGTVAAQNIAVWNGTTWSALGTGTDGAVFALAVSGTNLFAGGLFTTAGGGAASNIAVWNGTSWSQLGSGTDDAVLALAMSGTDLYVGGLFRHAGGLPEAYGISRWNGGWSSVPHIGNAGGSTYSLLAVGSDVYAGGIFSFVSGNGGSESNVAKWDGTLWTSLSHTSPIPNYTVHALAADGANIYAAGEFTTMGDVSANHIAKWDGTNWSALGDGASDVVYALSFHDGDLYVGGSFISAGGGSANHIAKWNGTRWSSLGSGTNSPVSALAAGDTNLYAGGGFTEAGNKVSSYFAIWEPTVTSLSYITAWNLVSTPSAPQDNSVNALYPTASSGAFAYGATGYELHPTIDPGTGYWIRFPSTTIAHISGAPVSTLTIPVSQGWNLIGSISTAVNVASITSSPPGIVTSSFFGYTGSYARSTSIEPGQAYWVKVNQTGELTLSTNTAASPSRIKIVPTNELPPSPPANAHELVPDIPKYFALHQNYPNPFNPTTHIDYDLPRQIYVTLKVYDILGQEVATLVDAEQQAGNMRVNFDASRLPSGIFFYRLQAGSNLAIRKMVLMK
jgi:hypothetical protein